MLDVYKIKKHIIDNEEYIPEILETAGFFKVSRKGKYYKCGNSEDTSGSSTCVNRETLVSGDFKANVHGDLITIVQNQTRKSFNQTLKFICNIVGLNGDDIETKDIKLPFGGFFKYIGKNKDIYEELKTYDENILNNYSKIPNKLFLRDGIPYDIQMKYEIGYDAMSGRITIPHRDTMGNLVGVVGRCNEKEVGDGIAKYFPIIPFSKSKVLFGYDKNYHNIQEKGVVILGESEKSVMKMDAMGLNNCLALGGNYISDVQAKNIQALMPNHVIIGLDEGIEEEHLQQQANKVKLQNPFLNIEVGYIYDRHNEIIKRDSKVAPMDLPKELLEKLMRNHTVWI